LKNHLKRGQLEKPKILESELEANWWRLGGWVRDWWRAAERGEAEGGNGLEAETRVCGGTGSQQGKKKNEDI